MNHSGVHNLFVYGTLRSGFKSLAYQYISRYFSFVGDARVKGKLFDLGPYPAGVPCQDESYVVGELYSLKDPEEFGWAFGQLDDYEGVSVEPDEIQLYKRELIDVFIDTDRMGFAWVYWYNRSVQGMPQIESGDMIQYLQQKNKPSAAFTE